MPANAAHRAVLTWLARPGVDDPSSETARSWIEQELARPEYQASWWQRLLGWIAELSEGGSGGAGSGAALRAVAVGLAVALVIGLALLLVRRLRGGRQIAEPHGSAVLDDRRLGAQQYRERAAEHRAAGEHGGAVLDGYRAIAASAVESGLLPAAPGATAGEIGRRLAAGFPDLAGPLQHVASLFDAVRYGGAAADAADAEAVADLDVRLIASAPGHGHVDPLAVPR